MTGMFWLAGNFNQDISEWDVSIVNDMGGMFNNANKFNQTISKWNVTNVMNMKSMFFGATLFNNGIENGTSHDGRNSLLFNNGINTYGLTNFNETNANVIVFSDFATGAKLIEGLDHVQTTVFYNGLFNKKLAITFTKVDGNTNNIVLPITDIDVSNPVSVSYIKNGTSIKLDNIDGNSIIDNPFSNGSDSVIVTIESGEFTHFGYDFTNIGYGYGYGNNTKILLDILQSSKISGISNFNSKPQSVMNLSYLFYLSTFNQDVGSWDVSDCTDMCDMFNGASVFEGTGIGDWNVSNCKNMTGMFFGASVFNGNVGGWERPADDGIGQSTVSNVENMSDMFEGATAFNGDISSWNVGRCTNMSFMFNGATAFNNGSTGSSADVRNSLLNSKFNATINVTTFNNFATGAKLIEDLNDSEITDFYNELFITEEE